MIFIFVHPRHCAHRFISTGKTFALSFLKRRRGATRGVYKTGSKQSVSGITTANLAPCFASLNGPYFRRSHLALRYGALCIAGVSGSRFISPTLCRG